ncbi:MAG TPA: PTS sugar transporter subunit IIA [Methylocystis sp.]|nr:PTS sugar transporter subunit IIA [Methylocystis sp.]
MEDITDIAIFVALGAAFAGGLGFLARWGKQDPVRICAYALIAVAFLYVGLSLSSDNPKSWTAIEMTGVALFGSAAGLSLIASPWFVVAGLALHPVWAIIFHYVGSGSAFTPAPLALATAGFDGALALFAAYTILQRKPALAAALAPQKKKGRA